MFRISLHKDNGDVLVLIKSTLGCGKLNTDRDRLVFTISELNAIETRLIPLFEQFRLNTTKYIEYWGFKVAFFMFKNRKTNELNKQDLYLNIFEVKNSIIEGKKHPLPQGHTITTTGNYLLGLYEGNGSFYLNKDDMTPHISFITTTPNKAFLHVIEQVLISLSNRYCYTLGSSTKFVNISDKKGNNKPISILEIFEVEYLCNVLIPYFDSLEFRTKKYHDYKRFRIIAFSILEGLHLTKKGKRFIIEMAKTMCN